MDLESGDTIYVEATVNRTVALGVKVDGSALWPILTTEEARILANALLAAVVESESHSPSIL